MVAITGQQPAELRRLFGLQALLITCVAAAMFAHGGMGYAGAAMYGGLIAVGNLLVLARRVRLATVVARDAPGGETAVLYIGAVQRFVMVLVAFGFGMGFLELSPIALLLGFAAGEIAFFMFRAPRA